MGAAVQNEARRARSTAGATRAAPCVFLDARALRGGAFRECAHVMLPIANVTLTYAPDAARTTSSKRRIGTPASEVGIHLALRRRGSERSPFEQGAAKMSTCKLVRTNAC